MHKRNVVRLVVVVAVSLVMFSAPLPEQSASACPYAVEWKLEYWRDPVCEGDVCEQVMPQLLGTYRFYCDGSEVCTGTCDESQANRLVYRVTRQCPLCEDQTP